MSRDRESTTEAGPVNTPIRADDNSRSIERRVIGVQEDNKDLRNLLNSLQGEVRRAHQRLDELPKPKEE